MADLRWNRVSNLEPTGPKAETSPLGHRGLYTPSSYAKTFGANFAIQSIGRTTKAARELASYSSNFHTTPHVKKFDDKEKEGLTCIYGNHCRNRDSKIRPSSPEAEILSTVHQG
ncbi:hypothetical protein AVEN_137622-1 [Araneus ventricosus]|uniref:Uncharacterized protein n=1 Tax=Araneus ventricosus TaxID=182803 RepID=A0A4Y2CTL2_ARAVE|nr:hypothetical protein AVEN_137622-1 [Araneus ventricosus]